MFATGSPKIVLFLFRRGCFQSQLLCIVSAYKGISSVAHDTWAVLSSAETKESLTPLTEHRPSFALALAPTKPSRKRPRYHYRTIVITQGLRVRNRTTGLAVRIHLALFRPCWVGRTLGCFACYCLVARTEACLVLANVAATHYDSGRVRLVDKKRRAPDFAPVWYCTLADKVGTSVFVGHPSTDQCQVGTERGVSASLC